MLCYQGGLQGGVRVWIPYLLPALSQWLKVFCQVVSLSACSHITVTWNPPTFVWNKMPDSFMHCVILMPLVVESGSVVCTSDQLYRHHVTLREVRTHTRPADSPLPWSQDGCGRGPSFYHYSCFLRYNMVTSWSVYYTELCDWWVERREGCRRAILGYGIGQ